MTRRLLTLNAALLGCLLVLPACGDDDPTPNDGGTPAVDSAAPAADSGTPAGPFIKIKSPAAGAEWKVGSTQTIEWETSLEDVAISYSTDGGQTWKKISDSVDVMAPDWPAYEWTVPAEPSTNVVIEVKGYDGEVPTKSETFSIVE